jgi:hypothetical protein
MYEQRSGYEGCRARDWLAGGASMTPMADISSMLIARPQERGPTDPEPLDAMPAPRPARRSARRSARRLGAARAGGRRRWWRWRPWRRARVVDGL